MKYLFIVNPTAGGSDRTEEIKQLAASSFEGRSDEYEIYVTTAPGDATREILERAERGEELRILSCGGDGTFNECCNGAFGKENISLAPFPVGTGNDFCRMFGPQKDLYRDLPALLEGGSHKIDLIDVNGRKCACIASIGIDARVGTNVHKYSSLPLVGGATAYVISLIVELTKGLCQQMKVTAEGYRYDAPAALCCVCNGRHYGGGFNPSPDAMPDDGILDVFLAKKMGFLKLAANLGKYASGRADSVPKIIDHFRTDELKFELEEETVINIDGETLYSDTIEMKVVPACLNLIVPAGLTFFDK